MAFISSLDKLTSLKPGEIPAKDSQGNWTSTTPQTIVTTSQEADPKGASTAAISNHKAETNAHAIVQIQGLQNTLNTKQALSTILSAIDALTTAGILEIKTDKSVATITVTDAARSLLDDTSIPAIRTTLGLGTAATRAATEFEPSGSAANAIATHKSETSAHTIAQITGLQNSLDSRQTIFGAISPNLVFASPATGNAATPTFRTLTTTDFPNLFVDLNNNQNVGGNKVFTGMLRAQGAVNENLLGIGRIDFGTQNSTARAIFESVNQSGTGSTVWQIDNQDGTFRWFIPGTTRMTLDSVGNLSLPNNSRFRAFKNAAQSLLLTTWTKISFQTESYDIQSEFDSTANFRFTAKTAGTYLFSAAVNIANTTAGTSGSLAFYVNGAEAIRPGAIASGAASAFSVSHAALIRLNVNDFVEVYAQLSRALSINAGTTLTYFEGVRLS